MKMQAGEHPCDKSWPPAGLAAAHNTRQRLQQHAVDAPEESPVPKTYADEMAGKRAEKAG